MTKDNYIVQIRSIIDAHHTQYGKFLKRPENKHLLDYIMAYESEKLKNNNMQTHLYWLLNGIHDFPICDAPDCNNPITRDVANIFRGYDRTACSCKCARKTDHYKEAYKKSINEHFGCDHPMHSQEIKDKVRETTTERWGGIGFASDEIHQKYEDKCMELYGVKNGGGSEQALKKIVETTRERFGVDNAMQCEEIKKKVDDTNLEKYGEKRYILTEEGQEQRIQTCIEKFGGRCPMSSPEVQEKSKQTKKERYGDEHYHNVEQMVKSQKELYGGLWGGERGRLNNKPYTTSKGEKEVLEFVKSIYHGTIIENDRTQMEPNSENNWIENHELDIWLPDIKVAIEFNGTYWHSLPNIMESDKFKRLQCESRGIKLFTISEEEWNSDKDSLKSSLSEMVNSFNEAKLKL